MTRTASVSLRRCWRVLKWTAIKYAYRARRLAGGEIRFGTDRLKLGPFEEARPLPLSITIGDMPFPADEALHGTATNAEFCSRVPGGLWVETDDGPSECIRYYACGLKEKINPQVLVYLGGDALLISTKGERHIAASYQSTSPAQIETTLEGWASQANAPALFLARPGLHGSSGNHHRRRELYEIALVDQALNLLKDRFGIASFIFAGQSGGGQIIAALLGRRKDIAGVALSSSLLSVRQAAAYWEFRRDIPGRFLYDARNFHDPIDDVGSIPVDPAPVIYIISDPRDQTVPFGVQLRYARTLRRSGHNVHHIFAHAPAPAHHILSDHARLAAALIARKETDRRIRAQLGKLDRLAAPSRKHSATLFNPKQSNPPSIEAQSAICLHTVDGEPGEMLFGKLPKQSLPPASLTKLMTTLVAVELMERFGHSLSDPLMIEQSDAAGGSGSNVRVGESISIGDSFANLLLPSSNITANAIARTFGSWLLNAERDFLSDPVSRFVIEMNTKAVALGMTETEFQNPTGLHAQDQLTCAADMAKLMLAVMNVPELLAYLGKSAHVMRVSGPQTRNQKIASTVGINRDYDVIGGKTGTLVPACYNLAFISLAPNGDRLVSVLLKAPDSQSLYDDARHIIDSIKRSRKWDKRANDPAL